MSSTVRLTGRMTNGSFKRGPPDVYRGYMPYGLPQHRPPRKIKPWWRVKGKPMLTMYPREPITGFTEEPEYPKLNKIGRDAVEDQVRYEWYDKLKQIPSVEGKLHELTRPASHHIAYINNWLPRYNSLSMAQYLTYTNIINGLPDCYNELEDFDANLVDRAREIVLSQIALEKYQVSGRHKTFVAEVAKDGGRETHLSTGLVQNMINSLKKIVAINKPEILDLHSDLSPQLKSWWYHSGFEPPNKKIFFKSRKDQDGCINQMIQMHGHTCLNLRSKYSLAPVMAPSSEEIVDKSFVKRCQLPLRDYGARFKFRWPVDLPGYWYASESASYEFPHTCFLSTKCLDTKNRRSDKIAIPSDDDEDCLKGQAILTAFGWLNSMSVYHGYTNFHELDYPFTCQVISTDGQKWLFNVYQLNSHTFHRDMNGPRVNNICYSTGIMQLYEDYEDGQFIGINDDVLKLVMKFLTREPCPEYTSKLNLHPLLGEDTRSEEEIHLERNSLRKFQEGRDTKTNNGWLRANWHRPLYEHLFFRHKLMRHKVRHMKPYFHIPKPKYPKIFE